MTRINLVDPQELMDQHLIAEYREIRLLSSNLQRTLKSKSGFVKNKVPKQFTLNSGHCYFFYNKGKYIHDRYEALASEMKNRGFTPQHSFPRHKWPDELYQDWSPSESDKDIVWERIKQRIGQRPGWYRYYGELINDTSN